MNERKIHKSNFRIIYLGALLIIVNKMKSFNLRAPRYERVQNAGQIEWAWNERKHIQTHIFITILLPRLIRSVLYKSDIDSRRVDTESKSYENWWKVSSVCCWWCEEKMCVKWDKGRWDEWKEWGEDGGIKQPWTSEHRPML